jgi:uncharacterized repeat protein (TIGR03803 family)
VVFPRMDVATEQAHSIGGTIRRRSSLPGWPTLLCRTLRLLIRIVSDGCATGGFEVMRSYYLLLCCALLAGCSSGAAGTVPVSTAANGGSPMESAHRSDAPYGRNPSRDSVAFESLYSFQDGSGDGANPQAGLLDVKGTFYGTTESGGPNGFGTVFAIAPSGTESVLHYFGSSSGDGTFPQAGLTNVKGTLYSYAVTALRRQEALVISGLPPRRAACRNCP